MASSPAPNCELLDLGNLGTPENVPGTFLNEKCLAVSVRNLHFTYPRQYLRLANLIEDPFMRKAPEKVLQSLSLSVPKGICYALLGSSGSGKTTLLKCILGRLQPTLGSVTIFEQTPGSSNCSIPGPGVGYMPQALALLPNLSIEATLYYFGALYRMDPKEIVEKSEHLRVLLDLPDKGHLVSECSGGQARRLSLACALIHRPPLLILDEPTVGVDPLLRSAIWYYLETLSREEGVTILLTTHYIEEATNAGKIGFVRDGRLLVEAAPRDLLRQHCLPRLEDVFFKLCQMEDNSTEEKGISMKNQMLEREMSSLEDSIKNDEIQLKINQNDGKMAAIFPKKTPFAWQRFRGQFLKNSGTLRRNLLGISIPLLSFLIFVIATDKPPHHLPVVIVNDESPAQLSASFAAHLDRETFTLMNHTSSLEDAHQLVVQGKALAVMHLMGNFSDAISERSFEPEYTDNETISASNVHLTLDATNSLVGFTLLHGTFRAIEAMMGDYFDSVGLNRASLSVPIQMEIIHGPTQLKGLAEAVGPMFMVILFFFGMVALTGQTLLIEMDTGFLERSFVGGVTHFEVLLSYGIVYSSILLVKLPLFMFTAFYLFAFQCKGSLILVFCLCFLQGIAGTMFGLFLCSLFGDIISVSMVAIGIVFPCLILGGFVWPVESLPPWTYWLSLTQPQPLSMQANRSIILRGWALDNPQILIAFVTNIAWVGLFLLLAIVFLRKV